MIMLLCQGMWLAPLWLVLLPWSTFQVQVQLLKNLMATSISCNMFSLPPFAKLLTVRFSSRYYPCPSNKHEAYSWNMCLLLIKNKIKTGLLDFTMVKIVEWCSSISLWSYIIQKLLETLPLAIRRFLVANMKHIVGICTYFNFKKIKTGLLDITMVKMVEWCSSISWWSYKI